jgi:hypothetical protein
MIEVMKMTLMLMVRDDDDDDDNVQKDYGR